MIGDRTILREKWEIRPRDGSLTIRGDLRTRPGTAPSTAVLVCHGFKGFREWGFFPALARAAALRGHATVTFDFTHNGVGEDGVDFSALGRFAENTHTRNVDEIRRVIAAITSGALLTPAPRRLALLGHSRGGAEAVIAASEEPAVDALVTWSAISSISGRWSDDQIETWSQGGMVMIPNVRTGQEMPIGPAYWQDILEHHERLDVLAHAARLEIPWLIVHGEADETVPVADGRTLFAAAGPSAELCLVEGGTHTFGATHPYSGPTAELLTAAQTSLDWIDRQLA